MGINCSQISDVSNSDYVKRLAESKDSICEHDPLWNQLFSFTFHPPQDRDESIKLEQITEENCRTLFENNQRTAAFSTLVKLFLSRSAELVQSVECENEIFVWQTRNLLFIIRHLCKFAVENMSEEKLVEQFDARSLDERKAELAADVLSSFEAQSSNFTEFVSSLIDVVANIKVLDFTYSLHVEVVNVFLVLLSPQIFLSDPAYCGVVSETMGKRVGSERVNQLMRCMLQNFIEQRPLPKSSEPSSSQQTDSLVLGLANVVVSGLKNVVNFATPSAQSVEIEVKDVHPTLARQSCLLLLALSMQKGGELNPFQRSLSLFRHIQGSLRNEQSRQHCQASFHVNLSRLYSTVCAELTSELTTLLLYNLLHCNSDVKAFILSKTDIEALVVPILKVLYLAPHHNSHHVYMALIILLILTEDNHFNKSIHDVPIQHVVWYTDRNLSGVSLGDLIILVLIRTIQFNMSQMRDQYLHTNCLAALANMSSHFKRLHPYAAQRIFTMISMLTSKLMKLYVRNKEMQLAAQNQLPITSQEEISNKTSKQQQENGDAVAINMDPTCVLNVEVVEEIARMLLEIVNSCLTGASTLRNNANLVYALLQSRTTFEKLKEFGRFQDVLQNVETLLEYFDARFDTSEPDMNNVEQVHELIKQIVVQIPTHQLRKFPELNFKYVEELNAEEFFVPYVWLLVYNKSGVFWNPGCVQLFVLD